MNRTFSPFLILAIMLALAVCGSHAGQSGAGPDPAPDKEMSASAAPEAPPANRPEGSESPEEPDGGGKKILIAYFSATNNTGNIASHLEEILDADLYEIVPETPYTSGDLNYNDSSSRANREQNDASARPAISGGVEDMEQYEVLFLGYPIWWGQAPKIISTFLESYDLSGKTGASREAVESWVNGLELPVRSKAAAEGAYDKLSLTVNGATLCR